VINKDLTTIVGDLVDLDLKEKDRELDREISQIKQQMGVYAGNFSGRAALYIIEATRKSFQRFINSAWDILGRVLIEAGSSVQEQQPDDLYTWVEKLIERQFQSLAKVLERHLNPMGMLDIRPLQDEAADLRNEFRAKIRLSQIKARPERTSSPVGDDERFIREAIEASKKSRSRAGKIGPRVGVVVVKDGKMLAVSYRGEMENDEEHAEYIALEKVLKGQTLAGATVYTTLEPCTLRNHPKVPCAERLIERKISRVVIGMLDPNPAISGKGVRLLRDHNIQTDLFPADYASQCEELNRDFRRAIAERVMNGEFLDSPVKARKTLPLMTDWPSAQRARDILMIGINLNLVLRQRDFFEKKIEDGTRIRLAMVDPQDHEVLDVLQRGVVEKEHTKPDFDASLAVIERLHTNAPELVELRVINYVPTLSYQVLDGDKDNGIILVELAPNKMTVEERPHFILQANNKQQKDWYDRMLANCTRIYNDASPWLWK
jgi:pyrimidine deaminase RibD-like protein